MAKLSIDSPKQFNFSNPDVWPRWKKPFQQFCDAFGLSAQSEQCQVSTLLYCVGEDADDVPVSTNVTKDERKRYKDVMAKFEETSKFVVA